MNRTCKFRLYPNTKQQLTLRQWLTTCRLLYNTALAERKEAWHTRQHAVSYYEQTSQLTDAKQTNPLLQAVHSQVLQDVLRRLDKTFQNFFRRLKKEKKQDTHALKGNIAMTPSPILKVVLFLKRTTRNSASRKLEVSLLNSTARSQLKA